MITKYSQIDPRWKNIKLGTCSDTIGQSGCKITCLGMLSGKTPEEVNKIMPYVNGCLTDDATAAEALGLEFQGRVKVAPVGFGWCIAETNHYAKEGVPQHFFVYDADTKIRVDPLDLNPVPEVNNYNIVSYRLFKPLSNETKMNKEFVKIVSELCGESYGESLNESEQKDAAKRLEAEKVKMQTVREASAVLFETVQERDAKIMSLTDSNKLYQANIELLEQQLAQAQKLSSYGIMDVPLVDLLRELKNRIIRF